MASCENCKKTGIDPDNVSVYEFADGTKILVGDCCRGSRIGAPPPLTYHVELSSAAGFVANLEVQGLRIEYRRTPKQIEELYSRYFGGMPAPSIDDVRESSSH